MCTGNEVLMVGIQAPLDWLMEIFWAGKGGEDPSETLLSKHFTGSPEAHPKPQGPVVEGYRPWGSAVCVCLCVRGLLKGIAHAWEVWKGLV